MNYVELNLFPEEEEEIQKDSDSDGSKKNRSVESNEYDYAVKRKYDFTNLFERLSKSAFRSRFHLSQKDREYITEKVWPQSANMQRISWPSVSLLP